MSSLHLSDNNGRKVVDFFDFFLHQNNSTKNFVNKLGFLDDGRQFRIQTRRDTVW